MRLFIFNMNLITLNFIKIIFNTKFELNIFKTIKCNNIFYEFKYKVINIFYDLFLNNNKNLLIYQEFKFLKK